MNEGNNRTPAHPSTTASAPRASALSGKLPRTLLAEWDILVVDDDSGSLRVAQFLLSYCGARVHTSINGLEGLKTAQKVHPKIIISDISMPVMDGWNLLRKVKLDPALSSTPVIALSAHALSSDRQRGLEAGFHTYLTKPLNPMTFVRDMLGSLLNLPDVRERLAKEGVSL